MTVPEARAEARKLLATFIEPARKDNGPRTPARPPDGRFRRGVPRPPGPALEGPDPGVQHLHRPQVHPARLRPSHRGRHHRRARQGLVLVHGRPARQRQPRHAGPVRHDAHGRALGVTAPTTPTPARTPSDTGCSRRRGFSPPRKRPGSTPCSPRRVLLPPGRRHHPPADAHRNAASAKSSPSNGTGFAASASTFPIPSPARAPFGCRAPSARSSTPSRATAPIAASSFRRVRRRGTSTTSSTNGTASATRRACPDCGFTTFAIAGLPLPP